MNIIKSGLSKDEMSSLEFLNNYINPARLDAGEKTIANDKFLKKVMDELDLEENDKKSFTQEGHFKPTTYFNLTHDQMMLVGMRESKQVRKSVLKKLNEINQPALPGTYKEALLALVEAEEQKELMQSQLQLAAPKVEFHDLVVASDVSMSCTDAAKKLHQKPRKFISWLKDSGYLRQNGYAYQRYIEQGIFIPDTGISKGGHHYTSYRVTSKGLSYFAGKLTGKEL